MTVSQPSPPPVSGQPQPGPGSNAPFNPPTFRGSSARIENNLVWAILATICCCIPTGIVSIVYAAQVNGKFAAGDIAGARQYANNARTWAIISVAAGVVSVGIWFFSMLI